MIDDLSDKEQIELFKQWWRSYGWPLLIAIIVGLGLGFGYRYWVQYKVGRDEQASQLYMEMVSLDTEKQSDRMTVIVEQLDTKYKATPYPAYAHLFLSKTLVDAKSYDKALVQLNWVIQHSSIASVQAMSTVRKARILVAQKQYTEALTVLDTVSDEFYNAPVAMLRGDIDNAQGDSTAAQKQYKLAAQALQKVGQKDPILEMKITQLEHPQVQSSTAARVQ